MNSEIEGCVYALVAKERALDPSELKPSSALSQDLGMEGDDAVEFFKDFEKKFCVDLKVLGEDWNYYFGPEGVPLREALLVVVPGSMISILFIRFIPGIPDWASFVAGFLLWTSVLYAWFRFFLKKRQPQITIQDLIDCAHAGKSTKALPRNIKRKTWASRHKLGPSL